MALQTIPFHHTWNIATNGTLRTQDIDGSTDGAGVMCIAPKTGNIAKIGFNVTAKTGTSPTYRCGVEGIGATRTPDGTYLASGAAYVDHAPSATGWTWQTLGTPAPVTAGDRLAGTIRYQSGTIDASNFITVQVGMTSASLVVLGPFGLKLTAGSWAGDSAPPSIALQYDDGEVVRFVQAATALTNNTPSSASNPKYLGNLWTPAVDQRIIGAIAFVYLDTNNDCAIQLYEGTDSSPTASVALEPDVNVGYNSGVGCIYVPFPPTTLSSGTAYRLVLVPTVAVNIIAFQHYVFPDDDCREALFGPLVGTTAGTAGTWTDYTTRGYPIFPVIDQVDSGSSGSTIILCGE